MLRVRDGCSERGGFSLIFPSHGDTPGSLTETLYCTGSTALTEELDSSGVPVEEVAEKNKKLIYQPRSGFWVF